MQSHCLISSSSFPADCDVSDAPPADGKFGPCTSPGAAQADAATIVPPPFTTATGFMASVGEELEASMIGRVHLGVEWS